MSTKYKIKSIYIFFEKGKFYGVTVTLCPVLQIARMLGGYYR